jgi:hypothetical protein
MDDENGNVIEEWIYQQITERHLEPVSNTATKRNGFTMMAIARLIKEPWVLPPRMSGR